MATLTIEILDAASGIMAEDVQVQVRKIIDGDWQQLDDASTDLNGAATLLENDSIKDGGYFEVLVFLGGYFDKTGRDLPQIKMVDIIPLRFGIESAQSDIVLHISATPHGYSADFSTKIKRLNLA